MSSPFISAIQLATIVCIQSMYPAVATADDTHDDALTDRAERHDPSSHSHEISPSAPDSFSVATDGIDGQSTFPQAPRKASSSRLIEEIIVTAQKREENLQDVPISINAFTAETLDARGISDPKDLPQATPGLYVGSNGGYTVTYLRGVGSDAYLLGDPSVALYIDNVYFPFAHGQAQNFGSIERVEVLKGPQGTLFGRNAVGGAISVVTQSPSFHESSGSVQVSFGSYHDLQTKGEFNIPLSDELAIGVSALYNSADNYRDGTVGGSSLPKEVTRGARLKVRWSPVDTLDVTLAGFKLEQSGVTSMFATNSDPLPLFAPLIQPQVGLDGANDAPSYFDLRNTVIYGQAVYTTDWLDVKLIGSDQTVVTAALYDFDGSPTPLVFFEVPRQGADVQTAELQFLSNETSWDSDKLKWIIGYYYFTGLSGLDRIELGAAGSVLSALNDILSPVLSPLGVPELVPETILVANGKQRTDSHSVFAQSTYAFSDWFSLTLGARLQDEKRTLIKSGGAVDLPIGPDIPYTSFGGQSDTTQSLSPKISLEFRPWLNGLIYTSYQKAVKSSTFNVVNFLRFTEPEPVKKEELSAYEVGVKKTLFNGSATLSSAIFYYDITNIQVQFLSLLAGGAVTFENAPGAEVKGIDFDVTSEIFPTVMPGLVLTIGGAYLDAEFTDYPDGQGFDEAGIYNRGNDYSGKRITRSPKFSGTIGLSQTVEITGGSLEIAADYYYNSGFYYLPQNTDFNEEPAYGLLGARISYLYEPWNLRTTVFGKNILDERYNYSRFTNDFGALDAVAPPAVYGVRLAWSF